MAKARTTKTRTTKKARPAAPKRSARGERAAKTRAELKEIRTRISGMTTVQVESFFNGFSDKELRAIQKGVDKAINNKVAGVLKKKKAQIEQLQQEIADLEAR